MNDGFMKNLLKFLMLLILLGATGFGSYKAVMSIWGKEATKEITNTSNVGVPDSSTEKEATVTPILVTAFFYDDVADQTIESCWVRFFNVNTKETNYVFVPNNTEIKLTDGTYQTLHDASSHVQQNVTVKTLAANFVKDVDRYRYTKLALQDLFGTQIQNYETITSDNAVRIVNLIDPVEFDVPKKLQFKDSSDTKVILKKGKQTLIGDQVKGMLSIEKLYDDEKERLSVNKDYIKAYLQKLYGYKNHTLLGNYFQNFYSLVETDTTFTKMSPYIDYFYQVTADNLKMSILPGEDKGKKFAPDTKKIHTICAQWTKDATAEPTTEATTTTATGVTTETASTTETATTTEAATTTEKATTQKKKTTEEKVETDSKKLKIEIINSTTRAGLAARWKTSLTNKGYKIVHTDTDWKNHRQEAEIYVSKKGQGKDLLKIFPKAKIIVKKPANADIQIVLGINQLTVK